MEIKENIVVKLHYKGTLDNGEVFDSSENKEPLEFVFGTQMIIPGLEEGIAGLKVGDKKTVKISSDKAYGPRHDQAVQEVPKEHFPQDATLEAGMQFMAQTPHGPIPVQLKEVKEDTVVVDMNHPLAGQDLTFDVEIVDLREQTPEEIKAKEEASGAGCGKEDCGQGACGSENCCSK